MADKLPILGLRDGLRIWKEIKLSQELGEHIPLSQLHKMAASGGLKDTADDVVDHLASCPRCLEEWAAACKAMPAVTDETVADDYYSGGMLEAAASTPTGLPVVLMSSCNRFRLKFLPDSNVADKGMITLEVVGGSDFDGRAISIRDRQGTVIIEGKIVGGRLARLIENFSGFDLQTWSLVVKIGSDRVGD